MGVEQAGAIERADPVRVFLDLLRDCLLSGSAHLANPETNEHPDNPTVLGWKRETVSTGHGFLTPVFRAQGQRIGWIDERGAYLVPEAALSAVQRFGRDQGVTIPWAAKTLGKRLHEGQVILSSETGRNTQKVSITGTRQRCWHIDPRHVITLASDGERQAGLVLPFREREGAAS